MADRPYVFRVPPPPNPPETEKVVQAMVEAFVRPTTPVAPPVVAPAAVAPQARPGRPISLPNNKAADLAYHAPTAPPLPTQGQTPQERVRGELVHKLERLRRAGLASLEQELAKAQQLTEEDTLPAAVAVPAERVHLANPVAIQLPDVTIIEPAAVTVDDVLRLLTQYVCVYISGRAGTGKTTLAQAIYTGRRDTALCATTGIAAVNLGNATTLNALIGYFDTTMLIQLHARGGLVHKLERLRRAGLRIILLDEVSMLPAPQLDVLLEAIEEINQTRGYNDALIAAEEGEDADVADTRLKLLLVGDFGQLPPVKEKFAFETARWQQFSQSTIKLEKVWRQDNLAFANALQDVRMGRGAEALKIFRQCLTPAMDPHFEGTTVVGRNDVVHTFNERRHKTIQADPIIWQAIKTGEQQTDWKKNIPDVVAVKPGALVMILMNRPVPRVRSEDDEFDGSEREYFYVNGDLGYVEGPDQLERPAHLAPDAKWTPPPPVGIRVRLQRTGEVVTVVPHTKTWDEPCSPPERVAKEYQAKPGETIRMITDQDTKERYPAIVEKAKGSITYMPLRLAYATTVHKSQGLSLDKVQVVIPDWMFTKPGMLYVALSRCRTLEGLRIVGSEAQFLKRCTVEKKVQQFL